MWANVRHGHIRGSISTSPILRLRGNDAKRRESSIVVSTRLQLTLCSLFDFSIESRLVDMDPEYAKDFAWLRSLTYDLRQYKGKFEQLKSVRQTKSLTDRSTCALLP
jgi:hypothetical protein